MCLLERWTLERTVVWNYVKDEVCNSQFSRIWELEDCQGTERMVDLQQQFPPRNLSAQKSGFLQI